MKNRFYTIILLAGLLSLLTTHVRAQAIIKYFTDMPGYLLPSLESSHKLELIENYLQNTKKDSAQNLFGGKVRMLQLDTVSHYISIRTTSVSRFEMKVFDREDKSRFIAVINTVCAPVCSSYIRFYDTAWKEIKMKFPPITVNDWMKGNEQFVNGVKIKDILRTSFIEFRFDKERIEAKNNSMEYLSKEEQQTVEPFLEKNPLSVKWENNRWIRE